MVEAPTGARYILTAAHVVAGATSITARPASGAASTDAVLVAIDAANDVALLVADLAIDALPVGEMAAGDRGAVVVFRADVPTLLEFGIVNPAIVNILDIYGDSAVGRRGYRVEIEIEAGDSGAVLVGPDGRADGVLYAKTRSTVDNAFATGRSAIDALMNRAGAVDRTVGVSAGACP